MQKCPQEALSSWLGSRFAWAIQKESGYGTLLLFQTTASDKLHEGEQTHSQTQETGESLYLIIPFDEHGGYSKAVSFEASETAFHTVFIAIFEYRMLKRQ